MFKGIDVLKFICALLVVYIHTYCYEPGWGWIKEILSVLSVPFFFIASGFFFTKGLKKDKDVSSSYLLKYVKRVTVMYLIWSLLSLPVEWMNISIAHAEYSWWMKSIYWVRCFFLAGSCGIYWYILSLIYNSIIIYFAERKKMVGWLYTLSVLFFGIGIAYDTGFFSGTLMYDIIHVSFGSTRNFLTVGLLYMCAGHYIAEHQSQELFRKKKIWLVLLFLIIVYRMMAKDAVTPFIYQFTASVFLFLFSLNWKPQISDSVSLLLRKWSTIIYLTHFPFILAFDYFLQRGTLIDYFCTLFFCACFYFLLKVFVPDFYLKKIYG